MILEKEVIFHLFSLVENLKIRDELVVGVVLTIIGLAFAGFFVLIRTYIRTYISEIVRKELEKNPQCIKQTGEIENLIRRYEEINNAFNMAFPRRFRLQQDTEDAIGSFTKKFAKSGKTMIFDFGEATSEPPAIIYSLKDAEEIYDPKKSRVEFDKEKRELIFRIKLKDRIAPDKISEESVNNGKNKSNP